MTTSDIIETTAALVEAPAMVMQGGYTLFNGDIVADCELHVVAQREQQDGTHLMEVEIRRHDGAQYLCLIDGKTLEDERALNAMGSSIARANWFFRAKTGSLGALKQALHAQPGNDHVVADIAQAGWNAQYSCWFGDVGMIDALGHYHAWSATGVRATCRDPLRASYRLRTFVLRRDQFGADIPIIDRPMATMNGTYELARGKLRRFNSDGTKVDVEPTQPVSCPMTDEALAKARLHMQAVMSLWSKNLGHHAGAIALGYMTAAACRHHAELSERLFPHLYVTGRTQYGKDTLARILAMTTGMNVNSVTSGGRGTTEKSIRNKLAAIGNTPLWLNELRADNSDQLLTLIRTSSDYQSNTITDPRQRVITFTANRPMMLVGEIVIGKDAEQSRYVVLRLNKPALDKGVLRQLDAMAGLAGKHWSQYLCDHNRAAWQIMLAAERLKDEFRARGCDSRRARGWSLAAAGIAYWYDADCHLDPLNSIPPEILQELYTRASDAMVFSSDDGVGSEWWSLLQSIRAGGELSNSGSARWVRIMPDPSTKEPLIAVWVPHLMRTASRMAPRDVPNKGLVGNELRADPGFVGNRNVRMGGEIRCCMVFDAQMTQMPAWVVACANEINTEDAGADAVPAVNTEAANLY